MNSERLTQHERRKDVPEAVRDEVGIVVAAFPARDRHGEEEEWRREAHAGAEEGSVSERDLGE